MESASTTESEPIIKGSHGPVATEAWAGEIRVNLIRVLAIISLYVYHIWHRLQGDPARDVEFHRLISLVVFSWAAGSTVLHVILQRRQPLTHVPSLMIVLDLVLTTLVLCLTQNPHTTLIAAYFLIIASSALRLKLSAVYLATIGSLVGYLFFLGHLRYVTKIPNELRQARSSQVILLIALLLSGMIAGQVIRQNRRLLIGALLASRAEESRQS
jgi:hypothetical protein